MFLAGLPANHCDGFIPYLTRERNKVKRAFLTFCELINFGIALPNIFLSEIDNESCRIEKNENK